MRNIYRRMDVSYKNINNLYHKIPKLMKKQKNNNKK